MVYDLNIDDLRQAVDVQLRVSVDHPLLDSHPEFKEMLQYQMGWTGQDAGKTAQGKRLRPLILLLSAHTAGGDWTQVLAASAAVELMHNFSLIHDDIQDQSPMRRGRKTIWVKWGTAQAINAGDAMLGLASLTLMNEGEFFAENLVMKASQIFQQTLLELTRGQYLDLAYENAGDLGMEDYSLMVGGKTGALLSCCMELGAIFGGASETQTKQMALYGRTVGKAFQIQDDWLGIWGKDKDTGKPSSADLIERKKSYPILLGLNHQKKFHELWHQTAIIDSHNVQDFTRLLEEENVKSETEAEFARIYHEAAALFNEINFNEERKKPLAGLVDSILIRAQ